MGIMRFVAKQVRKKTKLYYWTLVCYCVFTVVLALGNIINLSDIFSVGLPWVEWNPQWFWYFPWAGMLLAIMIVWLYYAPIVCDALDRLNGAFQGEGYVKLYENYKGWMQQFNWKMEGRSPRFKCAYLFFWGLFWFTFIGFLASAFYRCEIHWFMTIIFAIMVFIIVVLNYSSYYICIVFVYFLMRLCTLEREEKLDYIKPYPSSTYGFQALSNTFDTIVLYFLLDSLFCSITYFSLWQILSNAGYKPGGWIEYWAFLYATLFLILFGLTSWLYIILVSRIYLHRLHNHWKLRSYERYEEMYRHASLQSSEMDCILADIGRLNQDKLTMRSWEMLISLIAIAANLVTAASIFSSYPFVVG